MVFLVEGVTLDEAPQSVAQLYLQFGQLREAARQLVDKPRQVVAAGRSLYVTVREYAVTHAQDSKLDILGTDNLVNNVVIVIKNPGEIQLLLVHAATNTINWICHVMCCIFTKSEGNLKTPLFHCIAPSVTPACCVQPLARACWATWTGWGRRTWTRWWRRSVGTPRTTPGCSSPSWAASRTTRTCPSPSSSPS